MQVLSAADVHVIGTSESIGTALDLEVLPDGSVWLLNSVEPFFIGFGPDGDVLSAYGTTGGGPEEFRMPVGFVTRGLNGEAWVLDFVRNALIRVSEPGEWSLIEIPRDEIPPTSLRGGMSLLSPTVRTARLGDEILLPRTTGSLESGLVSFRLAMLGADFFALDPRTGNIREVLSLSTALDDPMPGFIQTDGGFPLWYRLWAVCGGDEIRVYDRVRNQLRGFSADGRELAPVDLPAPWPTEVTPEEFARAVFPLRRAEITGDVSGRMTGEDSTRAINQIVGELKGQPGELATYLPRYVDFRCSDDGTLWLQPIDLDAGGLQGSRTWLRVTPEGGERRVRLPDRFDPLRFTETRIWGVERDEFDVASVAWIGHRGSPPEPTDR